ncbi:hypothetical protein E5S69_31430 [Cupriavidus necator]|uniref:hypothetical protein n=1 Tax=Cupriavidus necator TaxID=106590 RepID=UPI0014900AB2|nr:hypothetical protein [Cupriavidus necator]NOV27999.1 hypothetical protein [Cupriavidus necator]
MKRYFWNILISIDQLGNALFAGDPDETISSRAGKAMQKRQAWGCILCKALNWFDKDHCLKSIDTTEGADAAIKG